MKKYKLKKDLPRAKAGSEVVLFPVKDNFEISRINLFQENGNNSRLGFIRNEDIDEWLEEIPQKPKNVWELEEGDGYYYLDVNLSFSKVLYFEINNEDDIKAYKEDLEFGNIYLSKEEAEKELEKIRAIQRIKKYCWENNIDTSWKGGKERYYIPVKIDDDIKIDYGQEYKIASYIGYFYDWNTLHFLIQECKNDLKIIFNI